MNACLNYELLKSEVDVMLCFQLCSACCADYQVALSAKIMEDTSKSMIRALYVLLYAKSHLLAEATSHSKEIKLVALRYACLN